MSQAGAFSLGISPAFVISCLAGSHLPGWGEAVPRCGVTLLFCFEGIQTLTLAHPQFLGDFGRVAL